MPARSGSLGCQGEGSKKILIFKSDCPAYTEAYIASAEKYRYLCAGIEVPERVAFACRSFVRENLRRSVLEWKAFNPALVETAAVEAGIPATDRAQVVDYIGQEFRSLHEGNVILYRLQATDLDVIGRKWKEFRLRFPQLGLAETDPRFN